MRAARRAYPPLFLRALDSRPCFQLMESEACATEGVGISPPWPLDAGRAINHPELETRACRGGVAPARRAAAEQPNNVMRQI